MRLLLLMIGLVIAAMAQTVESRTVMLKGTSLPGTCTVGERFFKTDATAGQNLYLCTATNTWTQVTGGSGASYPTDLLCNLTVATTVASFGAGSSGTNTCNFAGTRIQPVKTLTITGTPAAGTYCFEVNPADGTVHANLPGATTGLSASGMTMNASATCFTAGRTKIGKTTYTSGANWDSTVEDWRMPYHEAPIFIPSTLVSCVDSGPNRTCGVDTPNLYQTNYCRSTTGNDTYTCGTTPATTAYTRGKCYVLDADTANTGTATVNIDSVGARSILNRAGSALSDNDITANKPITVCYDGTQFIIQGDGGGSSTTINSTRSMDFPGPIKGITHTNNGVLHSEVAVRHWDVLVPRQITRIVIHIGVALPGGNTHVLRAGIYADGCGTKLYETDAYTGTATGAVALTFASPPTLSAGTYCVALGSNNTSLTMSYFDPPVFGTGMNSTTTRYGYCTNAMSGSGGTATLPSDCGTITTTNLRYFNMVASN